MCIGNRHADASRIRAALMPGRSRCAAGVSIIALLAFWVWGPLVVQAQEGRIPPFRESVGPYDVEIAVAQSSLSLGTAVLFVTVTDAATGGPVPDARVVLRILHEDSGKEGWATAHNTTEAPERYDAQLNLDDSGTWRITVEITSSLGPAGVEVPPLEVPAMQQFSAGTIVFAGVFAVLFAGVGYLWWSTQRRRRRSSTPGWPTEGTEPESGPGSRPPDQ